MNKEEMEKNVELEKSILLKKSSSFSTHEDRPRSHPLRRALTSVDEAQSCNLNICGEEKDRTLDEISQEIQGLIRMLSDKSDLTEIPQSIEIFANMVQSEIDKYNDYRDGDCPFKFGQDSEQDNLVMNAVSQISKLIKLLEQLPSDKVKPSLTLMILVLQRAMSIMEEDLRILLEDSMNPDKIPKSEEVDEEEKPDEGIEIYPGMRQDVKTGMKMIASSMVSSGYKIECELVYMSLRRSAVKKVIKQEGLENISMDDIQKMQWEALEAHITTWVNVIKHLGRVVLPGENHLCNFVFSSMEEDIITNLASSVVILCLNFAEAIAMTKRSAERLFKVLDVHEALTELRLGISISDELRTDISSVQRRLGEAAVCIFSDLENSIKNDPCRSPVPDGAVHPLTRYTMNYLKYACEFKHTLEEVFSQNQRLEPMNETGNNSNNAKDLSDSNQTRFALRLMEIMNLLDANIVEKSGFYKDPSLGYIFLMNNGRYVIQKIKESTEIHGLVGNEFRRRKSAELRGYHKNYQRETWGRVLQCLNQEGLQVNGKVHKPILKERFKNFNQMFDEIQRTQSSWMVSDKQLQSELQVSISAVMIPAYRSFLGRFGQYFTPGRQYEKHVKYQPEDIESALEGLFDGNSHNFSMLRRR